jgi:ribonuclease BN (tRNA processing enzyme)
VQLTVLGGCGAWPDAGRACSGYLIEHDGFRLLVDPGYATLPRLLAGTPAHRVDAVYVSHGHPDHCADLNPLLRARALSDTPPGPLPLYAPPSALDAVLALDAPEMLRSAYVLRDLPFGRPWDIGPFRAEAWLLPHWLPNAGLRLRAGDHVLAYTGDSGPSPDLAELGRDADLLIADATYINEVPTDSRRYLSSARQAGQLAAACGAGGLVLTHLWPGTDAAGAKTVASRHYDGGIDVAGPGLTASLGATPGLG